MFLQIFDSFLLFFVIFYLFIDSEALFAKDRLIENRYKVMYGFLRQQRRTNQNMLENMHLDMRPNADSFFTTAIFEADTEQQAEQSFELAFEQSINSLSSRLATIW